MGGALLFGACTLPGMRKVLVVDDDAHIRDVVCFALRREGFETVEAGDGRSAVTEFERNAPDLVILDIMMPEADGLDVCRTLRADSNVPILFLSSKDAEVDRIVGLEVGGDDYITKPFSPRELAARVKAQFRRQDALAFPAAEAAQFGPLQMNLAERTASVNGEPLSLTRTEFGLLATLARHQGRVLDRDALASGAYPGHRVVSDRTIDSHVRRLRAKLREVGADLIQTVHGVGFRLAHP